MFTVLPLSLSFLVGNIAGDLWFRMEHRLFRGDSELMHYFGLLKTICSLPDGDPREDELFDRFAEMHISLARWQRDKVRAWLERSPEYVAIFLKKQERRSERNDTIDRT